MDFSPQTVRSAGFKTVKKGYDPSEVDDFKEKVAAAIETAQNQATAMEARARAAVAKLQEVSQQSTTTRDTGSRANEEDSETISRTLLLAQRTADSTVSQADGEAAEFNGESNHSAPPSELQPDAQPAAYEFQPLMDPTPRDIGSAPSSADDETMAMHLDLGTYDPGTFEAGTLDVGAATTPSW